MNIEKLVSNHDIENFVKSQNLSHNCIFFENKITSITNLFPGSNTFAIIFLFNPGTEIGHWVLMTNHSTKTKRLVEYFDCLGNLPPKSIIKLCEIERYELYFLDKPLMASNGILCGKYCISRIMSKDTPLDLYYEMLKTNKKFTADELIDAMYRLQY